MKTDWIIHTIIDDKTGKVSGHTHSLDKFGSPEIEINLNIRPGVLGQYLNLIADHIVNKGLQIEDGVKVESVFNCPIYFFRVKSIQSDDEVLRAIFPDENMNYPWDRDCSSEYKDQIVLKGKYKL